MRYDKGTKELENWVIEEERFDAESLGKCEAIFCQGNGYLGVRNALNERYVGEKRGTFVTGTFDRFHESEVTELPNFPDTTWIEIDIEGSRFSMLRGKVLEYSRIMNLKNGEMVRTTVWEDTAGHQVRFSFRRIVSMEDTNVMAERMEIQPLNRDIEIRLTSGIDGTVTNTGAQHFTEGTRRIHSGRYLGMVCKTIQSGVTAAIHTGHIFSLNGGVREPELLPIIERRAIKVRSEFQLKKNEVLTVEKMTVIHTSRDLEYEGIEISDWETFLMEKGREHIEKACTAGYDILKIESAKVWRDIWEQEDIRIRSEDPFDQLAIRFAIYHLNIMVKKDDSRVGIGAKALSGEGYKGHSFWDTEIFILPYYMMTQPETARTLLEYRYKNLYGARKKALENGYEGAMYPWESAWIDDGETTPLWGAADVVTGETLKILTGIIEQHISADIAFAIWSYYQVTADESFMERCGYEMIFDTARFWADRVEWNDTEMRYEINDVIGPDEYKEHVNNNAYTNYMVHFNMELACILIQLCRREKSDIYSRLNSQMDLSALEEKLEERRRLLYLPLPEKDSGLIPQFDGFWKLKKLDLAKYKSCSVVGTIYDDYNMEQINSFQVIKQADVVLLMQLLSDRFSEEIRRRNFIYYEERTLHDSSLSKSAHCVSACELGFEEMAYQFFQGASRIDLGPAMKSSDAGIHSAAMGGIWQCVVMGFGGVRIRDGELVLDPILPDAWDNLFYRICFGKAKLEISVERETVNVKNHGSAIILQVMGRKLEIKCGDSVTVGREGTATA